MKLDIRRGLPGILVILTLIIGLVACGGGGSSSGDSFYSGEQVSGLWKGTVTIDGTVFPQAFGLLDQHGNFSIILPPSGTVMLVGSFRALSTGEVDTSFSGFSMFSSSIGLVDHLYYVTGTMVPKTSVNGTLENAAATRHVTVDLVYDPTYERASSLAIISANWVYTTGAYTRTLAIDTNGLIQGSDTSGCVYNGNISILDARYNLYKITMDIDGCYTSTVSTSGLATLTDTLVQNDTLIYVVTGYTAPLARDAFDGELTRQ